MYKSHLHRWLLALKICEYLAHIIQCLHATRIGISPHPIDLLIYGFFVVILCQVP